MARKTHRAIVHESALNPEASSRHDWIEPGVEAIWHRPTTSGRDARRVRIVSRNLSGSAVVRYSGGPAPDIMTAAYPLIPDNGYYFASPADLEPARIALEGKR